MAACEARCRTRDLKPAMRARRCPHMGRLSGILVQRDYYTEHYLRQAGFTNLEVANSPQSMLRMLVAGRRPAMALDAEALPVLLQQAGVDGREIEPAYKLLVMSAYITFPLEADGRTVERWRTTLAQMQRDGTFARMERHWFGHEAPPNAGGG